MAEGIQIAKAFIDVEARLKKESFDRARREAAQRLKGGDGQPPGSGGAAPPRTPRAPTGGPAAPTTGAPSNLSGLASPMDVRARLAQARAAFSQAGGDYGRALESGFTAALGNLGRLASQRVREAQRLATNQMANTPTPTGAAPAPRPSRADTPAPRGTTETPEAIAQRFTQRFASGLNRAAETARGLAGGGGQSARGAGGGGTVNNYNTRVEVDTKRIKELLDVVKAVNQLKARNRARPRKAPLQRRRRGATLRRTEIQNLTPEQRDERYSKVQALRGQVRSIKEQLRARIAQPLGTRVKAKWREERHTRFLANLKDKVRELGPGGGFRKTGQFYFNVKFRGAVYENRRETRNRVLRQQAWQQKESVRRQIAMLEGRPYIPTKRPKQGKARYFRPSVQARGKGGHPGMYGSRSADDGGSRGSRQHGRPSPRMNSVLKAFIKGFRSGSRRGRR